ncbi:MAG: hypothetical protein GX118_01845 [Arcobacter butzleri]|nr:hypothetical protein [Aliarcobacter butzleri]
MSNTCIIAKEGFKPLAIVFVIFFILKFIFSFEILGNLTFLLLLFMIYLFLNPEREVVAQEEEILSPIDGKIVALDNKDGKNYIYLDVSLLDRHILRVPDDKSMKIERRSYGINLNPNTKKGKLLNSQVIVDFETLKLHLLSGVCKFDIIVNMLDKIQKGKRFGFFLQGVATIEIDEDIKLDVKIGDKLKAGISIIGIKNS